MPEYHSVALKEDTEATLQSILFQSILLSAKSKIQNCASGMLLFME